MTKFLEVRMKILRLVHSIPLRKAEMTVEAKVASSDLVEMAIVRKYLVVGMGAWKGAQIRCQKELMKGLRWFWMESMTVAQMGTESLLTEKVREALRMLQLE